MAAIVAGVKKATATKAAKGLNGPFDTMSRERKRWRVIVEQNGKCAECGISHWRGVEITLELEHINGVNNDDRRENLKALCPNCHSLTETWRGRNNSGRKVGKRQNVIRNILSTCSSEAEHSADNREGVSSTLTM